MSHTGWNRQAEALLIRSACTSLPQATKLALFIYRAFSAIAQPAACPPATGNTSSSGDVCFVLKLHLNEQDTDKIMEVFRLLGNLCYMVKQSFLTGYFCLLIPSAGQNRDWWEADSFQKNKSAIFVQHSINFS